MNVPIRAPAAVSRAPLLWWLFAFVLHRTVLVAFGFDGVFFWEEAYRLLIAEAIRGGWDIPLHDLQADPYAGGSLVFSALTALAIPFAGASLVTVKLVALAWSTLGLWFWLLVADRWFGRTAAHALGVVWLAAPPIFQVFNVVGLGSHSDTITLTGLQWLLMYRYLEERRSVRLALWMAAGGIGMWFSYASAISLAVGVGYVAAIGALPASMWRHAAVGFAVGFSPWIVRTALAGGAFDVLARTFATPGTGGRGYPATLYDLAVHGVPVALFFRDIGIPGDVKVAREVFSYSYLAIYAVAWTLLVVTIARRFGARLRNGFGALRARIAAGLADAPELPILAVFPAFLLTLAASTLEFNDYGFVQWLTFRILVPALPSVFFAIALAAARSRAPVRSFVLAACVLAGLVGTGQIVNDRSDLRALRESEARETGAEAYGHLVVFKHGTDPVFASRVDALPRKLRAHAYRGIGFSFAWLFGTQRSETSASGLTRALLSIEPKYRDEALAGARLAIGAGLAQVAPLPFSPRRDELEAAIDLAEREPSPAGDPGHRAGTGGSPVAIARSGNRAR